MPGLVAAYFIFLRPVLKAIPTFKEFYAKADGFWAKVKALAGNSLTVAWSYFMAGVGFVMQWMPMWSKLKAVAHTLAYDAAIMGDYSLPTQRAACITVPTLVMGGEKSPAVLRRAVQTVADAIPNAQRQILKGQTHDVKPDVLAPVLVAFLGRAGLPASVLEAA